VLFKLNRLQAYGLDRFAIDKLLNSVMPHAFFNFFQSTSLYSSGTNETSSKALWSQQQTPFRHQILQLDFGFG